MADETWSAGLHEETPLLPVLGRLLLAHNVNSEWYCEKSWEKWCAFTVFSKLLSTHHTLALVGVGWSILIWKRNTLKNNRRVILPFPPRYNTRTIASPSVCSGLILTVHVMYDFFSEIVFKNRYDNLIRFNRFVNAMYDIMSYNIV